MTSDTHQISASQHEDLNTRQLSFEKLDKSVKYAADINQQMSSFI
jgi:hypothetical protein